MALNFIPPTKDAQIKVISPNVAFYDAPTASAGKLGKINPAKTNSYSSWVIGDAVKATGNVLQNSEGTWVEATTPKWQKKNIISQWRIVLSTVYYRAEDNTATWLSDSVTGSKPTDGSVGGTTTGTTTTTNAENPTPTPTATETNNNLAYAGIAIGILGLLTRKN